MAYVDNQLVDNQVDFGEEKKNMICMIIAMSIRTECWRMVQQLLTDEIVQQIPGWQKLGDRLSDSQTDLKVLEWVGELTGGTRRPLVPETHICKFKFCHNLCGFN